MAVGGSALHWGGTCNRFSEEDLRLKSMYGLHVDWPIEWKELEKFYCEAERRLGVSGEPSPLPEDWRSEPYPMPAMVMTHNLKELKAWAEKSGIPFWSTPQAKNTRPYDGRAECIRCNTCSICPTGARYSPDFTFKRLLERKNFALHDQTLVRKLMLDDAKPTVAAAQAVNRERPDEPMEYRAPVFVLASGYCWSPHLLLLSRCSRFPDGLANRSGLVGRYMCGHAFLSAHDRDRRQDLPGHERAARPDFAPVFPLPKPDQPFVRHDLRIWESAAGHEPRLRCADGRILLGDSLLADWRERAKRGTARVRGYYDVHPDRDSASRSTIRRATAGATPCPRSNTSRTPHRRRASSSRASTSKSSSRRWPRPTTARFSRPAPATTGTIPRAAAAWARRRHERLRQLRPDARPREPVRGRLAHAAERRMHQRHPDLRGADPALGGAHRGKVPKAA